jgi:hypothetical protein
MDGERPFNPRVTNLWVKPTINRRDQSEENNYWFGLRIGNTVSFCANQHDNYRGNYYNLKTRNYRNYYYHNLYRWHGHDL